jgi:hypothetical protein
MWRPFLSSNLETQRPRPAHRAEAQRLAAAAEEVGRTAAAAEAEAARELAALRAEVEAQRGALREAEAARRSSEEAASAVSQRLEQVTAVIEALCSPFSRCCQGFGPPPRLNINHRWCRDGRDETAPLSAERCQPLWLCAWSPHRLPIVGFMPCSPSTDCSVWRGSMAWRAARGG